MIRKIALSVFILLLVINLALAATRTFRAEETDFVKIIPEAVDLDLDQITYTFSPPLDEKGEWQTDYGDAGEYDLDITASDGKNESVERVHLIINKKNQPPVLEKNKISVSENQQVDLKKLVDDPDDDVLEFKFQKPFDKDGLWKPSFTDAGVYLASFTVSDGQHETIGRVEVTVINANQPPHITKVFREDDLTLEEDQELSFFVEAEDGDKDGLSYEWLLDGTKIATKKDGKYQFGFDSAGDHTLKVVVTDGSGKTERSWAVHISNKNRKPTLSISPVIANEGDAVTLPLPKKDADGDDIAYAFEKPFNTDGIWQTSFDDAGQYEARIVASDGQLETAATVPITILDVDRVPQLDLPSRLEAREGEVLVWDIVALDPDGDKVILSVDGAPEDSILDQKKQQFRWSPDFTALRRKGGFFSNMLNAIRLEKYFIASRTIPLTVKACGKDLCSQGTVDLVLFNVNQPPQLEVPSLVILNETQKVAVQPAGSDADGDILRYHYTEPLNGKGEWTTSYDDEGAYTSYVTVTDGSAEDTKPVNIEVRKTDRQPELIVAADEITVNEGQEFTLYLEAADPDGDEVAVSLQDLPPGASFRDGVFVWTPPYTAVMNRSDSWQNRLVSRNSYLNKRFSKDLEVFWLNFVVEEGMFRVEHPIKVRVKNVDQAPQLSNVVPADRMTVRLNEPVVFHIDASDPDGDELEYRWHFSLHEPEIGGTDTIERVFTAPGVKTVSVTVSDGWKSAVKEWVVDVLDEPVRQEAVNVVQDPFTVRVYVIES